MIFIKNLKVFNCSINESFHWSKLPKLKKVMSEENFNFEEIVKLCRCEQYQQTLQEIKEICKNSYTSASEDYYRTADKILQKITKAES